jgi:hypothetical protein
MTLNKKQQSLEHRSRLNTSAGKRNEGDLLMNDDSCDRHNPHKYRGRTTNPLPDERTSSDVDAEFVGWQRTPSGERVALFTVTGEEHPLYPCTVTEKILREQRLQIPAAPAQERLSMILERDE